MRGHQVLLGINGVDISDIRRGVRQREPATGKPLKQECRTPGVAARRLVPDPRGDCLRVDALEEARKELEVEPLVLQPELKVTAEGIGRLVLRRPGADLATVSHLTLAH